MKIIDKLKKQITKTIINSKIISRWNDRHNLSICKPFDVIEMYSEKYANTLFEEYLDVSNFNFENLRQQKIMHVSTYDTFCGVADFCNMLKTGLENVVQLNANDVCTLDVNNIKKLPFNKVSDYYAEIAEKCKNYDTVILQHEFSFFLSQENSMEIANKLFIEFIENLNSKSTIKNIFVILHSSPDLINPFSLSSIFWNDFMKIKEITKVKILSTNPHMSKELAKYGIFSRPIIIPVDNVIEKYPYVKTDISTDIKNKLSFKKGDIIISMVGFITPVKRHEDVLEILDSLPENYKFLIIGDVPPQIPIDTQQLWKETINKKIFQLGLENRVYITGHYKNEDLKSYITNVDMMLVPYSNHFKLSGASVLTMIQTLKPVIAYATEALARTNEHCQYKPLELVEDNNKIALEEAIKTLAFDKLKQDYLKEQAIGYIKEMTIEKLAKLVLINIED